MLYYWDEYKLQKTNWYLQDIGIYMNVLCDAKVYYSFHKAENSDDNCMIPQLRVGDRRLVALTGIDPGYGYNEVIIEKDGKLIRGNCSFNEKEEIDLAATLQNYGIPFEPLDAKEYQKVRARKVRILEKDYELHGEYSEKFGFNREIMLNVISASVRFFHGYGTIGKHEISKFTVESYSVANANEIIYNYSNGTDTFGKNGFPDYIYNQNYSFEIGLDTGTVQMMPINGEYKLHIKLDFDDGEFDYYNYDMDKMTDKYRKFIMKLLDMDSAQKCKGFVAKAKMMGYSFT